MGKKSTACLTNKNFILIIRHRHQEDLVFRTRLLSSHRSSFSLRFCPALDRSSCVQREAEVCSSVHRTSCDCNTPIAPPDALSAHTRASREGAREERKTERARRTVQWSRVGLSRFKDEEGGMQAGVQAGDEVVGSGRHLAQGGRRRPKAVIFVPRLPLKTTCSTQKHVLARQRYTEYNHMYFCDVSNN